MKTTKRRLAAVLLAVMLSVTAFSMYKVVSVFDVSQTDGKPLPTLASDLAGNVQNYDVFMNVAAIRTLLAVEKENRQATPEEQAVLSRYVGWGGVQDAFDESKPACGAYRAAAAQCRTPSQAAPAVG